MSENGSWYPRTLGGCFDVLTFPGKAKVLTRDYKTTGRFPVVDQGQERIAGWTDDDSAVINSPLPVVVFGDHTRALKFVDFPFARGADGTQILKPHDDVDPLFFYYACRSLELPSRGYNRHLSLLREQVITVPATKHEQLAIGQAARTVDRASEHQAALGAAAERLKYSAMRELFTRGLRAEPQKDSEIGPLPKIWEPTPLEQLCEQVTVGVVVRPASHYVPNGVPAFRSLNVREDRLDTSSLVYFDQHANDTILSKSKLRAGDVLVVRTGYPGTSCVVPPEFEGSNCIDLVVARPRTDVILPGFLSRFLNAPAGRFQTVASSYGLAQQHLNVEAVKRVKVPVPTTTREQQEILDVLDAIDRKIDVQRRKRGLLEQLFKSLLHKLMTGDVRVSDLDLSVLPVAT